MPQEGVGGQTGAGDCRRNGRLAAACSTARGRRGKRVRKRKQGGGVEAQDASSRGVAQRTGGRGARRKQLGGGVASSLYSVQRYKTQYSAIHFSVYNMDK